MVIAFWNLYKKEAVGNLLIDFVLEYEVDLLFLAEVHEGFLPSSLPDPKNPINYFLNNYHYRIPPSKHYNQISAQGSKVEVLTSLDISTVLPLHAHLSSKRWGAYKVKLADGDFINVIPVHLPSKVSWDEQSQSLHCPILSQDIREVEKQTQILDTVLIGDFNMNPFEAGIVAANGLNAVQDLDYAHSRKTRTVDGISYRFFYNPMWSFYAKKPYGTHYFRSSGHVSQEWNIFDQIMVRPSLKDKLETKEPFKIVTKFGNQNLATSFGRPDKKEYSDHFPILLRLK